MNFERRMRRSAILKLIQGLTTDQQKELQPVSDAILKGMRTGTEPGGAAVRPQP